MTEGTNTGARWMSVEDAARHLGVNEVTLRRRFQRCARKAPDGAIQARVDGITARKLGTHWKVWLSPGWSCGGTPK